MTLTNAACNPQCHLIKYNVPMANESRVIIIHGRSFITLIILKLELDYCCYATGNMMPHTVFSVKTPIREF